MNVIVIAVDGLRASALGAYGNTSFETPGFDRLASESLVADWCHGSAVELSAIYQSLWYGVHPLRPVGYCDSRQNVAQLFAQSGYHTTLLSDQLGLAEIIGATHFDEIELLEPQISALTESIGTTHFASIISHLGQLLDPPSATQQIPQFVWVHTDGMFGPWDAPLALRTLSAEEDDPEPYNGVESPRLIAETEFDPDERLPYLFSYAAQVQILDACIGALLEMLEGEASVCVVGLRGFPLGERGVIGGVDDSLSATRLHVPMLIRAADGCGRLQRISQLTEQTDLTSTLCELAGLSALLSKKTDGSSLLSMAEGQRGPWRDHSIAASSTARAIRTPSWCLQCSLGAESFPEFPNPLVNAIDRPELYVKPDDVIEVNDVADLRNEIADELLLAITDFQQRCENGESLRNITLPEQLTAPAG